MDDKKHPAGAGETARALSVGRRFCYACTAALRAALHKHGRTPFASGQESATSRGSATTCSRSCTVRPLRNPLFACRASRSAGDIAAGGHMPLNSCWAAVASTAGL